MGFPALRLPYVPLRNVYHFLDYTELILLSQCSKTCYSLVKSIESNNKEARINITTQATQMIVKLSSSNDWNDKNRRSFRWSLHTARDSMSAYLTEFKVYRIGGHLWTMSPHPKGFRCRGDYNVDYLICWVNILKDLFNCKLGDCDLEGAANFDFHGLFCSSNTLHVADTILIEYIRFTDKEMEFVMDNLETKKFICGAVTEASYFYDKPIRFPVAYLSAWYIHDFANFMDYMGSCESLLLSDPRITDNQVNTAIRGWLESDNTTLAGIIFERDPTSVHFSLGTVLEGITTFPGAKKRKGATRHNTYHTNFERGRDFMRKDGVLATVQENVNPGVSKSIIFTIWSDKNCNLY